MKAVINAPTLTNESIRNIRDALCSAVVVVVVVVVVAVEETVRRSRVTRVSAANTRCHDQP